MPARNCAVNLLVLLFLESHYFFLHFLAHFTLFGNGFGSILLFLAHFYWKIHFFVIGTTPSWAGVLAPLVLRGPYIEITRNCHLFQIWAKKYPKHVLRLFKSCWGSAWDSSLAFQDLPSWPEIICVPAHEYIKCFWHPKIHSKLVLLQWWLWLL